MSKYLLGVIVCLPLAAGTITFSYSGTLPSPEDYFTQTFTLTETSDVQIATHGFAAGGFDPLVALFSVTGIIAASADTLTSFIGNCPPAATVMIGGNPVCGDVLLQVANLAPGDYTLLLSDANYIPFAVDPGPPFASKISDGFFDLTGGVFQTCSSTQDGLSCISPTGDYAVDLTIESSAAAAVPEPDTWGLVILIAFVGARLNQQKEKI